MALFIIELHTSLHGDRPRETPPHERRRIARSGAVAVQDTHQQRR